MHLDKTIFIAAPPGRVYPWLSPGRQPSWDKSLVRVAPRDGGPLREGSVFDRVTRALGHRFLSAAEATRLETDRAFGWRQVEGDFEQHAGAFTLEEAPGGTRVRFVADVDLPFVLPRLTTEAEVRRSVSRSADEGLWNLKRLAESGA